MTYRYLPGLLSLVFLLTQSFCLGQDRASNGKSLVKEYLKSNNEAEREVILKSLEELKVDFNTMKEWVKLSSEYIPQKPGLRREFAPVGEKKGEYFIYIPSSYTPEKEWPMILSLHGVGGNGHEQVITWLKSMAHNDEFIFAAPTYGSGLWWKEEPEKLVLSVLDKVKQGYRIDTNRIYLTGFSSGGHGVWYMGIRYPWLFAAINPIAGECPLPSLLINLKNVPVFIIHGAKDTVIPVEAGRDADSRLEKLHYNVIYKELPELKHRFPAEEAGKVIDWFRVNKRIPYPKEIKFSTESPGYSIAYWIEITEFSELVGQTPGVYKDISGKLIRTEGSAEMATVEANAQVGDNEIYLITHGIKALRLYLEDGYSDAGRPLRVNINGKLMYFEKMEMSVRGILDAVRKMNDREALYSAYLDIRIPSE
ncbi:MAG: dienelactone hydrolase family protein [Candidatus Brocadia sp.]|nr:dienelactone hydrolase family protein [Candidatus Brocadia sp.]